MEWNDINKSAPDDFGAYLATNGEDMQVMNYLGCYKGNHEWSSYICNTIRVTHWMEIPKWINIEDQLPPKEKTMIFKNGKGEITIGKFWGVNDEKTIWIHDLDRDTNEIGTHWIELPEFPT